jgi:hypothetical protein
MSHPFKPIDAFKSPRFSQIATFLRLPHHRAVAELDVALLGVVRRGRPQGRPPGLSDEPSTLSIR